MWRKVASRVCVGLAAFFLFASLITQWGYSQIFSTDTFVTTANTVITEPVVQEEIAATLVDSLTSNIPLPAFVNSPLERLATQIVASDSFGEFWSDAIRKVHEPLIEQLTSDIPITQLQAQRIDLQPLVQSVLDELRAEFPQLSRLLPQNAPATEFDLLSGESLQAARDATSLVQKLRWVFPFITIALLVVAYFGQQTGQRRPHALVGSVTAAALLVFAATRIAGSIAESFASDRYADVAATIARHVVQPLARQSLVLLALCAAAFATLFIQARRERQSSTD